MIMITTKNGITIIKTNIHKKQHHKAAKYQQII